MIPPVLIGWFVAVVMDRALLYVYAQFWFECKEVILEQYMCLTTPIKIKSFKAGCS